jgi:hypothetical protein
MIWHGHCRLLNAIIVWANVVVFTSLCVINGRKKRNLFLTLKNPNPTHLKKKNLLDVRCQKIVRCPLESDWDSNSVTSLLLI